MTRIALGDIAVETGDVPADVARAIVAARVGGGGVAAGGDGTAREPCLLFRIGGAVFGLGLGGIGSVVPVASTSPVPGTPPALVGLFARRGRIWNLCDPASALRVVPEEGAHMLLLRGLRPRIALRVDRARGVALAPASVDPADAGRLTRTVLAEDGTRFELVAIAALIEALGLA